MREVIKMMFNKFSLTQHTLSNLFRFVSLLKLYYRFNMFYSFNRSRLHSPVPAYKNISEITDAGNKLTYVSDPSYYDNIHHPQRIQYFIDNNFSGGDCDDSATWWCAALIKSKLADNVWLTSGLGYWNRDGVKRFGGHSVCVFQAHGQLYWTGNWFNNKPQRINMLQDFAHDMDAKSGSYKSETTHVVFIEVVDVDERDTLVFGNTIAFEPKQQ